MRETVLSELTGFTGRDGQWRQGLRACTVAIGTDWNGLRKRSIAACGIWVAVGIVLDQLVVTVRGSKSFCCRPLEVVEHCSDRLLEVEGAEMDSTDEIRSKKLMDKGSGQLSPVAFNGSVVRLMSVPSGSIRTLMGSRSLKMDSGIGHLHRLVRRLKDA